MLQEVQGVTAGNTRCSVRTAGLGFQVRYVAVTRNIGRFLLTTGGAAHRVIHSLSTVAASGNLPLKRVATMVEVNPGAGNTP
jgi:hypothetical protein